MKTNDIDQHSGARWVVLTVTCWTRHVVTPGMNPVPITCTTRQLLERTSHSALNGSTNSSDALTTKPQSSPVNPSRHTHLPARSWH